MASGHVVPHQQAGHMAAPTSLAPPSKKTLANTEPSTHGTLAIVVITRLCLLGPVAGTRGPVEVPGCAAVSHGLHKAVGPAARGQDRREPVPTGHFARLTRRI
jgi:hypothetical protein